MHSPTDPRSRPGSWRHRLARRTTTSLGAFGVTAAVFLGSCGPQQCAPAAPPAPAPAPAPSGVARQVIDLTNARRAEQGLPALVYDAQLATAAQAHSQDQARQDLMSHTGSDGSNAGQRIERTGYVWSAWGENVAMGYTDAGAVVQGWMNSPAHRANILSTSFTEIGIGLAYSADGAAYWTMVLARPI